MAKNRSKWRDWLEYSSAATLIGLLRFLPLPAAWLLAQAAARLLDAAVPKLRRAGQVNLSFALPELSPARQKQILDGVFTTIARLLLALARMPALHAGNVGRWITYEGLSHYLDAKAKGRGILVATAHFGNWELSAYAHAFLTEPMHVMVRPLDNPLIDALVESRRSASGNHLIFKKDAVRSVFRALKQNDAVGILIDQNTTPAEGVFIDFFGKQACASSAFVKLAHHSGAAVIPGFLLWEEAKQRYVLYFYPEIPMSGDVQADTQRIHSFFEQLIRRYPDQWMWIHRRWKTRPPGEPPLY